MAYEVHTSQQHLDHAPSSPLPKPFGKQTSKQGLKNNHENKMVVRKQDAKWWWGNRKEIKERCLIQGVRTQDNAVALLVYTLILAQPPTLAIKYK